MAACLSLVAAPASAAAVEAVAPFYRVWRGYARPDLPPEQFQEKLNGFVPATKDWLAGNAGLAYLPAIPSNGSPAGLPDELALVAYASKDAYDKGLASPAGQAYQESHWELFERPGQRTKSASPVPFDGSMVADQPYDALNAPVDWQHPEGQALFILGKLKKGKTLAQLADLVTRIKDELAPMGMDGHVVVADANGYLASWQHWRSEEHLDKALHSKTGRKILWKARSLMSPALKAKAEPFAGQVEPGKVYDVRFPVAPPTPEASPAPSQSPAPLVASSAPIRVRADLNIAHSLRLASALRILKEHGFKPDGRPRKLSSGSYRVYGRISMANLAQLNAATIAGVEVNAVRQRRGRRRA